MSSLPILTVINGPYSSDVLAIQDPNQEQPTYFPILECPRGFYESQKVKSILQKVATTINDLKIDYPYPVSASVFWTTRRLDAASERNLASRPEITDSIHQWFLLTDPYNESAVTDNTYHYFLKMPDNLKPYFIILGCQSSLKQTYYRSYEHRPNLLKPNKTLPPYNSKHKIVLDTITAYDPKFCLTDAQLRTLSKIKVGDQQRFNALLHGLPSPRSATTYFEQLVNTSEKTSGKDAAALYTKHPESVNDRHRPLQQRYLRAIPRNVTKLLEHATYDELNQLAVLTYVRTRGSTEIGIITELLREKLTERETLDLMFSIIRYHKARLIISTIEKILPNIDNVKDLPIEWWYPLYFEVK